MTIQDALAIARYYGSSAKMTDDERHCLNEALKVIHIRAKKAFDRFMMGTR
jgi:hypothetical protein